MPNGDDDLFGYHGPDLQDEGYAVYRHLRDSPYCEGDRAHLRALWARFRQLGLADPDFLAKFPRECPSRIWEMRLACILADWGLPLVPARRPGKGPDFGITMDHRRVMWIEATAPTPGAEESKDRVRAEPGRPIYGHELERTTSLRYLSAISAKLDQYKRALAAGLVHADDGFAVAISGSQIPLADLDPEHEPPRIVKALFGVGAARMSIEIGTGRISQIHPAQRVSFRKSAGEEISARLFLSPDALEISAVLFDPHHVKNRPEVRGKEQGRDFVLVHNPFARVPFPMGAFQSGREFFAGLTWEDHRSAPPRKALLARIREWFTTARQRTRRFLRRRRRFRVKQGRGSFPVE